MKEKEKAVEAEIVKKTIVEETFDGLDVTDFENASDGDSRYANVYFVKPRLKNPIYFEFKRKVGEVEQVDPRTDINRLDGKLTKVVLGTFTYNEKEIKTLKLYIEKLMKDKLTLFIVNLTPSNITRSIINSLLNVKKPIEKINIAIYKNDKDKAAVKLLINGQKAEWLYDYEEIKPLIDIVKNKKGEYVSSDYQELDEKFHTELQNHLSVLFPDQHNTRFTNENKSDVIENVNDVEIFGEDEENFFEIEDVEDEKTKRVRK